MFNKCFHLSNSYVFSKSKHSIIHKKFYSFTKGSIESLIESLWENKFLHLEFKEIEKVVSIQPWLLLQRNKKGAEVLRFWKIGSKKKIAGITRKTHSQNTLYSLFCLICSKSISVEHQGKADLLNSKRAQRPITQWFVAVGSDLDKLVSATKVKVTGFLTEHNLLFTTAGHLGPLFRNIFPDSKIAKAYVCGKTIVLCILNCAISPEL